MKTTLAALLFLSTVAHAYTITSTTTTTVGAFTRTDYIVAASSDPIDHFRMTHVIKTGNGTDGTMLLTAPLAFDFEIYAYYADDGVLTHSTAYYLADHGVDVWGWSPRGYDLAAGYCAPTSGHDCSVVAGWNMASAVVDIKYERDYIVANFPPTNGKLAVGGLSLGAMSAIAYVNAHPSDVQGALFWEGGLYTADSTNQTLNQGNCAAIGAQVTAGLTLVDQTPIQALAQNAKTDPVIFLAFVDLMVNPPPIPPLKVLLHGIFPTYQFLLGNGPTGFTGTNFAFANDTRALDVFAMSLRNYANNVQVRDVVCALGGDRTYTGNLSSFTGVVFALGGTHGFGQAFGDLLGLFTSASDKRTNLVTNYGHIDHYCNPSHLTIAEGAILTWLRQRVF